MGVRGETTMKRILLTGLLLVCGLGCKAATLIGAADGAIDAGCGVIYPQDGFYGPNILYPGYTTSFVTRGDNKAFYEIAATHPAGVTVTLKMTLLSGPVWYHGGYVDDWHVTTWDENSMGEQTFATPNVVGESETTIFFQQNGQARLDIFECGASTPTSSKTITWYPEVIDAATDARVDGAAVDARD
jgi:hypothetical protein